MITVNDIRGAIQDLPGDAPVYIAYGNKEEGERYNNLRRQAVECTGFYNGNVGSALMIVLGSLDDYYGEKDET